MEYLDFELPIKELEDQLQKCYEIGEESAIDVGATCKKIERKLEKKRKNSTRAYLRGSEFNYPDTPTDLILWII